MSKDITIEKVGVPQELNGVKKIITNSPDFFQATWIPEESTKPLGKLTVHRNGHYEASDFYAYGFDEVEVDVPQTPPEIEGIIDWDIPPIDIDFPDIDINIDDFDIGDIDIDIPDIDPMDIDIEDLEIIIKDIIIDIIDDLDIDIDIDDIDIDIPDIDLSDFTPEELKDLIDDIIKDIITDILGDLDIDDIVIDVPDVDVRLPDVEIPDYPSDLAAFSHIDENGNIVGITNQDLEDMGKSMEDIAAMEDPVITIDDLGNIDIVDSFGVDDFGGVEVIDLAIGDVDLKVDGIDDDGRTKFIDEYLPTSIELTVPPRKIVYHEGEAIDLTGAIVSAKYKGGTAVWANEKYKNGIIPLGELIVEPDVANITSSKTKRYGDLYYYYTDYTMGEVFESGGKKYKFVDTDLATLRVEKAIIYVFSSDIIGQGPFVYFNTLAPVGTVISLYMFDENKDEWKRLQYYLTKQEVSINLYDEFSEINLPYNTNAISFRENVYPRYSTYDILVNGSKVYVDSIRSMWGGYYYPICDALGYSYLVDDIPPQISGGNIITLSWHRPKDGKLLSTSFEITTEETTDNDNS